MNRFLRINEDSPDKFLLKKLTMVIEEFLRNHYLKSFGYKKKRLDDSQQEKPVNAVLVEEHHEAAAAEEEYYYDEEEDQTQTQNQPKPNQA